MGSNLVDEGDRERERGRLRDEKAMREGFGLATIVDHDGIEMPSSFHPCPLASYVQFSIRRAVKAYSIHLDIGYSGTSTVGIYSIDGIYSTNGIYSTGN
ncbi:hypothetical protein COCNU_04G008860 [Cocos nucifera]|uniref:Uncharacterized protein n=1 Tax=Cocos nucifera TaxID=13894 RepID=A0A8K0I644_COCNU|nr:hypothetical protein COCNU_04G008860 [Cocos nucifera]